MDNGWIIFSRSFCWGNLALIALWSPHVWCYALHSTSNHPKTLFLVFSLLLPYHRTNFCSIEEEEEGERGRKEKKKKFFFLMLRAGGKRRDESKARKELFFFFFFFFQTVKCIPAASSSSSSRLPPSNERASRKRSLLGPVCTIKFLGQAARERGRQGLSSSSFLKKLFSILCPSLDVGMEKV